jgi:hypothetical protein
LTNEETRYDVVVIVESSTIGAANAFVLSTCRRYVDAPVTALQLSVRVIGWFVAPLTGESRVGTAGTDNGVAEAV